MDKQLLRRYSRRNNNAILFLLELAALLPASLAQGQFTTSTTYFQSLNSGTKTTTSAGSMGFGLTTQTYQVNYTTGISSGISTASSNGFILDLDYNATGTVSMTASGAYPANPNFCQNSTEFSISGNQLIHYLYSSTYSGPSLIDQLDTGFNFIRNNTTLASRTGPGPALTGSGIIDLNDGSVLKFQSHVGANLLGPASCSYSTFATFQVLPATPIPIGSTQTGIANAIWAESLSGNFSDQTRWMQNVVAGNGTPIYFNTTSSVPYTVNLTSNTTTSNITVQGNSVNLAMGANTLLPTAIKVLPFGDQSGSLTLSGSGRVTVNSGINIKSSSFTLSGTTLFSGGVGYIEASNGKISITNGAVATTAHFSMLSASVLSMNVGDGSTLNVGSSTTGYKGTLINEGIIQFKASPNAVPGNTYKPINAGTITGGTFQSFGGIYNSTTRLFTASSITSSTAGIPVNIDLSQSQRLQITDPANTQIVNASFQSSTTSSILSFVANPLNAAQQSLLGSILGSESVIESGWIFNPTGYTDGTPVYLSMYLGAGHSSDQLSIWHYDGLAWSPYAVSDLSYDGNYANFTVTGFSGYAVTSSILPEPASLGLFLITGLSLLNRRRNA